MHSIYCDSQIGVINTTYAAIEFMGKTNGGNGGIVMNIASTLGLDYLCVFPAYTASKHGVVALTRTFAVSFFNVKCSGSDVKLISFN